jgi:hypothetical protein
MLPVTEFPDAEKVVIDYLVALLADEPEFSDVTIDVRGGGGRHIRVRRIGGTAHSPAHDLPTLDVMVWHDTDLLAMRLTQRLWAWLRAANNDPAGDATLCYSASLMAPRQMPDPADSTKTLCMCTVEMLTR